MAKVLLVEDDEDLLEMVSMMLRATGLEVVSLTGGIHFFETIRKEQPAMILMDIYLGDSDGRELCKQTKSTAEFSKMPVLLYSAGHITDASVSESNADDFIQKPFEMPILIKRVRELIAKGED